MQFTKLPINSQFSVSPYQENSNDSTENTEGNDIQ